MIPDLMSQLLDRCSFPTAGTPVDCAVSGGPDSLALLVLAIEAGLEVTAWHVDHGLRSTSAAEGRTVVEVAGRLGAQARRVVAQVADGPNLEARARDARRAALPPGVLTGHTADDQAETVLMNLLRGSGVPGAAGIGDPHRRPGPHWSFDKDPTYLRVETEAAARTRGSRVAPPRVLVPLLPA